MLPDPLNNAPPFAAGAQKIRISPEALEQGNGYVIFRPELKCSLTEATAVISSVIVYAREHEIRRLLVDSRKMIGFAPPETWERFWIVVSWMENAMWSVKWPWWLVRN